MAMPSTHFAELLGLGLPELLIILAIVLLLFGGKKLPQLARGLGSSVKELRASLDDAKDIKNMAKQSAADIRERVTSSTSEPK
jgi:sec-independent protein translocase protein TatA